MKRAIIILLLLAEGVLIFQGILAKNPPLHYRQRFVLNCDTDGNCHDPGIVWPILPPGTGTLTDDWVAQDAVVPPNRAYGTVNTLQDCRYFVVKQDDGLYTEMLFLKGSMPRQDDRIYGIFEHLTIQNTENITSNTRFESWTYSSGNQRDFALAFELNHCIFIH